jgi:hypothetical protein
MKVMMFLGKLAKPSLTIDGMSANDSLNAARLSSLGFLSWFS